MLMLNMLGCIHKNLIYTIEFTYLRRKFSFVINIIIFTVLNNSFSTIFHLQNLFRFYVVRIFLYKL